MKKVLLLGPLLSTGGVSKYVKDLLNSKINYEIIHFNTARPEKTYTSSKGKVGYNEIFDAGFIRFLKGTFITLRHLLVFPFVLMLKRPHVVHISGVSYSTFWENAYYIFISKLLSKPIFFHYLGAFDLFYGQSSPFAKFLIRNVLKKVDKIALLSRKVKIIMSRFIPESRLYVLPSTVRVSDFLKKKKEPKILDKNLINILFVGGADPFRKGLADVVKSIPLVARECENFSFILTGGENVNRFLVKCKKMGISSYVNFWGWVKEKDKIQLYHSADILLLPSYNEGLPYVIIEALAAGLPIIATPIGGISEVIEDGVNGLLIDPGDYYDLAKKIVILAKNKSLRDMIARNNFEKARKDYSLEILLERIADIHQELV